jgi:DNA-binding LytR/AlgR family response regulator
MVGYLIKPVNKIALRAAIQSAIQRAVQEANRGTKAQELQAIDNNIVTKNCLYFKKKGVFKKVLIRDIVYIQSDQNYCNCVNHLDDSFITRETMNKLERMLPERFFLRVHRKYIINLSYVDSADFQQNILILNGHEIPVSRYKRKEVEQRISLMN